MINDLIPTYWKDAVDIVAYIIAIASIVVKLTPTPNDDAALKQIIDFLSQWIALNPRPKG